MPNQTSQAALRQALQDLVETANRISAAATQLAQRNSGPPSQMPYPQGNLEYSFAAAGAEAAAAAAINLTTEQHDICERVINVFETGSIQGNYAAISIFHDGPGDIRQITYGRSQTTEYGNLPQLVRMYVDAGGIFSEQLREFVNLVGHTALVDNSRFIDLLKKAGAQDQVMRRTQDVFFDQLYFQPAMKWASNNGFTLALSALVIYDSYIHSGSIRSDIRSKFSEVPPARGGEEKAWIRAYINARHAWLLAHHRPDVRASAYRTKDLAREIARGNWDLSILPIIANGTPVNGGAGIIGGGIVESFAYPDPGSADQYAPDEGNEEVWGDDTYAARAGLSEMAFPAAAAESVASLATTIMNSARISLATVHTSGVVDQANPRQNIVDTAAGGRARRSHYGTAPGGTVMLDPRLLRGMVALSQQFTFSVAEICGGSHNSNSRHYAGIAADFNVVNGRGISASHPDLAAFKTRCRELGATEILGPGAPHHETHVHAAWPRP